MGDRPVDLLGRPGPPGPPGPKGQRGPPAKLPFVFIRNNNIKYPEGPPRFRRQYADNINRFLKKSAVGKNYMDRNPRKDMFTNHQDFGNDRNRGSTTGNYPGRYLRMSRKMKRNTRKPQEISYTRGPHSDRVETTITITYPQPVTQSNARSPRPYLH